MSDRGTYGIICGRVGLCVCMGGGLTHDHEAFIFKELRA